MGPATISSSPCKELHLGIRLNPTPMEDSRELLVAAMMLLAMSSPTEVKGPA